MNFYQKKRRTPVLQIISMIDVLIILLIFLVVSTTFKDPRKSKASAARSVLNISMPVTEAMNLGTDSADRVSLTVTSEDKCFLADVPVPLEKLTDSLRIFKESSPGTKLDLRIDKKVSVETLFKIWDSLTKAQYNVGDVPARVTRAGSDGSQ